MTFKQFLILLGIATGLLWSGWVWTLFAIDPLATNWLGFLLFYLTLFLAATGTICLAGVAIRQRGHPELPLFYVVARSFRQSVALSLLVIGLLLLQSMRLLHWWNALILAAFIAILEVIALHRSDRRHVSTPTANGIPDQQESEAPHPLFTRKEVQDE